MLPSPHAEFNVDWAVSDGDGNLDTVEIVMEDSSWNTVDSVSESVSGGSASKTTTMKAKFTEGFGNEYDITLTVTDTDGNTAKDDITVKEDDQ